MDSPKEHWTQDVNASQEVVSIAHEDRGYQGTQAFVQRGLYPPRNVLKQ